MARAACRSPAEEIWGYPAEGELSEGLTAWICSTVGPRKESSLHSAKKLGQAPPSHIIPRPSEENQWQCESRWGPEIQDTPADSRRPSVGHPSSMHVLMGWTGPGGRQQALCASFEILDGVCLLSYGVSVAKMQGLENRTKLQCHTSWQAWPGAMFLLQAMFLRRSHHRGWCNTVIRGDRGPISSGGGIYVLIRNQNRLSRYASCRCDLGGVVLLVCRRRSAAASLRRPSCVEGGGGTGGKGVYITGNNTPWDGGARSKFYAY